MTFHLLDIWLQYGLRFLTVISLLIRSECDQELRVFEPWHIKDQSLIGVLQERISILQTGHFCHHETDSFRDEETDTEKTIQEENPFKPHDKDRNSQQ